MTREELSDWAEEGWEKVKTLLDKKNRDGLLNHLKLSPQGSVRSNLLSKVTMVR
jgi:hypothetical protein